MEKALEKVFEGRKVRFLPRDEEVLVPLPDIAGALDYDAKSLRNMIGRNSEIFDQGKVVTTLPSAGGPQKTICLTRDGVVGLLMKLATGRIKDIAKRQMIVSFQRWAIKTISEVMQGSYGVGWSGLAGANIGRMMDRLDNDLEKWGAGILVSEPAVQAIRIQGRAITQLAGAVSAIREESYSHREILLAMQKQMGVLTQAVTVLVNQAARAQQALPVPPVGPGDDFKLVIDIKRQQNKNGRRVGYKVERLGLADQVAELLKMGHTYQEVANLLGERGIKIGTSSLQRFTKSRFFD